MVAGGYARALLPAMLQGVEAQVGEIGGFRMAVDGEDTAFFAKFIERYFGYCWCSRRSSEVSQGCLNSVRSQSSKVFEPQSIRNRSFHRNTDTHSFHRIGLRDFHNFFAGSAVATTMREGPS